MGIMKMMSKYCKGIRQTFSVCVICGVVAIFLMALFEGCPMWLREPQEIDIPIMLTNKSIQREENLDEVKLIANASSSIWDGIGLTQLSKISGDSRMEDGRNKIIARPVKDSFHPGMDAANRIHLRNLIGLFDDVAKQHNVTYFLYGGSLIGSFRHHGMVPWDDDVDVAVHVKDLNNLKEAFNMLPSSLKATFGNERWKLSYSDNPKPREELPWSFPFLDISFFKVIPGFVIDGDPGWANRYRFKITDIFPLTLRPFWDMWLPAPRNTRTVLERTYNVNTCMSNLYSHRKEEFRGIVYTLSCDKLRDFFPFVVRNEQNNSSVLEELVFNGKVIQRLKLST